MLFKTQIRLIDKDWNDIFSYDSKICPNIGQYIWLEEKDSYYSILRVIHSVSSKHNIICVVEGVNLPRI